MSPEELAATALMAETIGRAVRVVLEEFLKNAPPDPDARFIVQTAFLISGMQSLHAETGAYKTAAVFAEAFKRMSGQDMVGVLYGAQSSTRIH